MDVFRGIIKPFKEYVDFGIFFKLGNLFTFRKLFKISVSYSKQLPKFFIKEIAMSFEAEALFEIDAHNIIFGCIYHQMFFY